MNLADSEFVYEGRQDRESFVETWILFHHILDSLVYPLLHHGIDEVFLVALEDDAEEEEAGGLMVREFALLEHGHFIPDQEVAPSIHYQLREYSRCSLLLQ